MLGMTAFVSGLCLLLCLSSRESVQCFHTCTVSCCVQCRAESTRTPLSTTRASKVRLPREYSGMCGARGQGCVAELQTAEDRKRERRRGSGKGRLGGEFRRQKWGGSSGGSTAAAAARAGKVAVAVARSGSHGAGSRVRRVRMKKRRCMRT